MARLSDSEIRKRIQTLFRIYQGNRTLGDLTRAAEKFCEAHEFSHGISKAYIHQLYAGTASTRPSLPKLVVMNRVFGIPMDELIKAYLGDDLFIENPDKKGLSAAEARLVKDSVSKMKSILGEIEEAVERAD